MSETSLLTPDPLVVRTFTFDKRREGHSLQMMAKRYTATDNHTSASGEITLILTTGIGSGTEVWIPTIKRLYSLQSRSESTVRIGAVWAVESQNQGDAAVLNEKVLKEEYSDHFLLSDYGLAVRHLLASGLVDCESSKVVGIGHSAGCHALTLAVHEIGPIPFHSLILIEPTLLQRSSRIAFEQMARHNGARTRKRVDVWPTKGDAISWMKKRSPWKTWHPEVLDAVSEFGFRSLPTVEHPGAIGVTPKIYKGQEAVSYASTECTFEGMDLLARLCDSIPVQIISAGRKDFFPKAIEDLFVNPSEGQYKASVTVIPNAGHWVLQEKPDELSDVIFEMLSGLGHKETAAKL